VQGLSVPSAEVAVRPQKTSQPPAAATGRRASTAAAVVLGGAAAAGIAWAFGAAFGYHNVLFAWTVHFVLMGWASVVLDTARPALTSAWFQVRGWEPGTYRRLGAWGYMRLLRLVGWERLTGRHSTFAGTRSSLSAFDRQTRQSEYGHLIIAALVVVVSAAALSVGAWDTALWLSVLNVPLHVYPVLLQRSLRGRIQLLQAIRTAEAVAKH
jgi:hypothetical protein